MSLVEQIMEAAGSMPDPAAHRRYLKTLTTEQLEDRLEALTEPRPANGRGAPTVKFWSRAVALDQRDAGLPDKGQMQLV